MRKLINQFNFGKNNKISAVLAMLIISLIVLACNNAEKPAAPPTDAESQALVKNSISEFADAVDKDDFKAFKANTSKEFQSQFSDEQLKTTFKSFTDQKADVVPILRDAAKMTPKFTTPPAVRDEKGYSILVANGSFDTEPATTKFTNEYVYQDGKWKLLKINVNL
jgi:hypothetical protein